jgi:hypothetical protein
MRVKKFHEIAAQGSPAQKGCQRWRFRRDKTATSKSPLVFRRAPSYQECLLQLPRNKPPPSMLPAVMTSLFATAPEIPFSARRETAGERFHLMHLMRRTVPSTFRPPPLPSVFGPGTTMPKGAAVPKPKRKSKKR